MISWTRAILSPIAAAAVVCAVGSTIAGLMHHPPATREMFAAALIALFAAEVALLPVWLVRHKAADSAAQGALIATVIHMGVCAGVGLAFQKLTAAPQSFLYWLCALYWATLLGVCRVLTRVVKSAPGPVNENALADK
jgi:hypothetical protein